MTGQVSVNRGFVPLMSERLLYPMQLWIEGSIEQVIAVANSGVASAIATNPTIIDRWTSGGQSLEAVVTQVCANVTIPVYVQLHGPTVDEYLREMDHLRAISDRIHPKLVASHAGLAAAKQIADSGLKPLITTVATLNQAYLAACAGASYAAPYVGRLHKAGVDTVKLIGDMVTMYRHSGAATQVAAASISSPQDAEQMLLAGASILVMQYDVYQHMLDSELTAVWIEHFEDNWTHIPYEIKSAVS
ncbi:MAG: hypothetical protein IPO91_00105 [Chloroflexi bacterium]|nr:hypothetical protein [Chloroflexota bacterium]